MQAISTSELRVARIKAWAKDCGLDPQRFAHCRTWKDARREYRKLANWSRMMLGELGSHYESLGETREGEALLGWQRQRDVVKASKIPGVVRRSKILGLRTEDRADADQKAEMAEDRAIRR